MNKKFLFSDIIKYKDFPFNIEIADLKQDFLPHSHDFSELVIILDGNATHVVDEYEYYIKAGDAFVIQGNTQHGFKNISHLKLCNIMFDLQKLNANYVSLKKLPGFQYLFNIEPYYRNECQFDSKLFIDPVRLKFAESLLSMILDEFNNSKDGFNIVIEVYFLAIITFLSRHFSLEVKHETQKLYLIAEAIAYIENNFTKQINIEEVSKMCHFSTRQFFRIFKQTYGISPSEHIHQLRMNMAARLLMESRLNITQISIECGFSDISFFSRQFKAHFSVSPRDFRNTYAR